MQNPNAHPSVLLIDSGTHSSSASACSSLSETLLPNVSGVLKQDLVPLLQYQVFQGRFLNGQKFWINSKDSGLLCQAVDTNGVVSEQLCILPLPALCTQSGNSSFVPTFKTTVATQGLSITGYALLQVLPSGWLLIAQQLPR